MQDIQFKANSGQFNIDQAQGIVECFVAGIGNKDSVGDIVASGAFAKSLVRRKPRVVWGHNWNDPIGKVLEIYEVQANDPRLPAKMKMAGIGGLYAKVQFNLNSEKGREAFANVAFFGEEQEWSIGYKTLDAVYDNNRQANVLKEVELYEVSPVLHGANQLTGTISVKSEEEKMHMMMGMPGMVAVQEKPRGPVDPFEQGLAQPADSDRIAALERELSTRTGSPVKVVKANESSVMFMKPGKGVFRLSYYFDGEQYMFGKPERLGMPVVPTVEQRPQRPQGFGMPAMTTKPNVNPPEMRVRYGDEDDSSSMIFGSVKPKGYEKSLSEELDLILEEKSQPTMERLREIVSALQEIVNEPQPETDYLIKCAPEDAFETKQALDPVFEYHGLDTYVTEEGIIVASPMNHEAYEAVETATKSLLRGIGRAIGGGGGKVRRGRAALSRIEGVLDPRERRDHDGDGLIFDGTRMEQPVQQRGKPEIPVLASRRNYSGGSNRSGSSLDPSKPRKEIILTRPEQKKLTEMLSAAISEGEISENSPIKQLADAIKNSVALGEGRAPDISPELFNAFKKDYDSVREILKRNGGKKEGQRGRSPFEIIDEFVNKGSYKRTNLGTDARTTAGAQAMINRTQTRPELPASNKKEFTEKFLPKNWDNMQPDERFDWWFSNISKLEERSKSQQWRKLLSSFESDIVKDEERYEKRFANKPSNRALDRRRSEIGVDEAAEIRREAEESIEQGRATSPKKRRGAERSETGGNKFTRSGSAISVFIDKNKANISEEFESVTKNALEKMDEALADNDGKVTEENLKDAQEAIEEAVKELEELASQRRRNIRKRQDADVPASVNRGEDESAASKREQDIITGLRKLSEAIGEDFQKMSSRESEPELNPMDDILRSAARVGSSRRADDGDESLLEEIQTTSMSTAKKYVAARGRRKQGTGLMSQRSGGEKAPRTEVVAESTWWKSVADSLPKEIREADDSKVREGLKLLKDTLDRQEAGAFTPGSKRTNVGSLRITAQEADMILDSVMAVVDRQMSAGKDGGVGTRAEIFAELLEKISRASMSTFVNKTSGPADAGRPKR
jgi:HK97 family phage prohead protease